MLAIQPIVDAIKFELGSVFSTSSHQPSNIIRYINSAIRDLSIERNFTFNKFKTTVTVISGTTDYSIPLQIETFYVFDSNNIPVTIMNFENYYNYILQTTNISPTTTVAWIWDETFVCDTAWVYTIVYRWDLAPVTSFTDTVAIPSMFQDTIIAGALKYWYMDEKDFSSANLKQQIFMGMVKSLASRNTNTLPTIDIQMGKNNRI